MNNYPNNSQYQQQGGNGQQTPQSQQPYQSSNQPTNTSFPSMTENRSPAREASGEAKPVEKKMGLSTILSFAIIALLLVNLVIGILSLLYTDGARSAKTLAKEDAELTKYYREIGEKNVSMSDDEVVKEEYNTTIDAKIKNTGKKDLESITVVFHLYQDDEYIGDATEYVDFLAAGDSLQISCDIFSETENFDEYELAYISAQEAVK